MATTVAYEIPGFSRTTESGADFTADAAGQHRFVVMNSSQQVVNPSASGRATGVRCNKPNVGQATTVRTSGIVMVEAAEAIAVDAAVSTDNVGRAVNGATTGEVILGRCVVAASGTGVLCSVELHTEQVKAL
jgi:hypothetical protein